MMNSRLWQCDAQPTSKLGCIYTTTSRLASFQDYGAPIVDDTLAYPLPPPPTATSSHAREVFVDGKSFLIWSPNSQQDPYYPGPLEQVQEWDLNRSPPSYEHRWDGQLGPSDPTISPQYFNRLEPWLAFIARDIRDPYLPDDVETPFVPAYDRWISGCDDYMGHLDHGFVDTLKREHGDLDKKILKRKQRAYGEHGQLRRDMLEANIFPPSPDNIEGLKKITRYADAVVVVRRFQRMLLKKRAWLDMVFAWDTRSELERLRRKTIQPADDNRMGLWINGNSIPEYEFLWFLTEAKIPCFVIQKLNSSRHSDAVTSFIAKTPIEPLVNSCLYDQLARLAGGTVVALPPRTIQSVSPSGSANNGRLQQSARQSVDLKMPDTASDEVILVDTSPGQTGVVNTVSQSVAPRSPHLDPDEIILAYRRLNVTNADLDRLHPGKFLNDTLVELGVEFWLRDLEKKDPELAKRIHIFSPFFYKQLDKENALAGYESVRKWTKFDLFDKKYLIVPINAKVHWYLAIIYQPEHILPPSKSPQHKALQGADKQSLLSATEAEIIDIDSPPNPDGPRINGNSTGRTKRPRGDTSPVLKQPRTYIFTLDSMGDSHPSVVQVLGQYLRQEALTKRGIRLAHSNPPIGMQALVPKQPNNYDCGVYLLHIAQVFISDPEAYCTYIIEESPPERWNKVPVNQLRRTLRRRIEQLSVAYKKEHPVKDVLDNSADDEVEIVDTLVVQTERTSHKLDSGRTTGGQEDCKFGVEKVGPVPEKCKQRATNANAPPIPAVRTDLLGKESRTEQDRRPSVEVVPLADVAAAKPHDFSASVPLDHTDILDAVEQPSAAFEMVNVPTPLPLYVEGSNGASRESENETTPSAETLVDETLVDASMTDVQEGSSSSPADVVAAGECSSAMEAVTHLTQKLHIYNPAILPTAGEGLKAAEESNAVPGVNVTMPLPMYVDEEKFGLTVKEVDASMIDIFPLGSAMQEGSSLTPPPAKRQRLSLPRQPFIVPAARPPNAPPRAQGGSKKRGKRSGNNRKVKDANLELRRGLREAGLEEAERQAQIRLSNL